MPRSSAGSGPATRKACRSTTTCRSSPCSARELTNDEVTLIADELAFAADPESAEAIKTAIAAVTNTKPSDADVARVRSHLAAGGWPLATPHQD